MKLRGRTKTTMKLPLLAPHMSDELFPEPEVALPAMPLSEHVVEDYVATGLSLKVYPVRFFRDRLTALGAMRNIALRGDDLRQDARVTVAGRSWRGRLGTGGGRWGLHERYEDEIQTLPTSSSRPKAFARRPPHGGDRALSRRARPPANAPALSSMWSRRSVLSICRSGAAHVT